jgi:hypothetical protein
LSGNDVQEEEEKKEETLETQREGERESRNVTTG